MITSFNSLKEKKEKKEAKTHDGICEHEGEPSSQQQSHNSQSQTVLSHIERQHGG